MRRDHHGRALPRNPTHVRLPVSRKERDKAALSSPGARQALERWEQLRPIHQAVYDASAPR